jgi:hypothetical protein
MTATNKADLLGMLKERLIDATWPDEPSRKIFPTGSVRIVSNPDMLALPIMRSPIALIAPSASVTDDEEPGLDIQTVMVRLALHHQIDRLGERGLSGSAFKPRGMLTLEEAVRLQIQTIHRPSAPVISVVRGNSETVHSDNNGSLITQDLTISAPVAYEE